FPFSQKKGEAGGNIAKRKLARLKQLVGERERWREKIEQLKRMRQWILDAEDILKGSWAQGPEQRNAACEQSAAKKHLTNKEVGLQWDTCLQKFSKGMTKEGMSRMERD